MDVTEKPAANAVAKKSSDFTDQLIEPFSQLRSEVDRLFESFPLRLPSLRLGRTPLFPAIETTETEKHYKVTAELPVSSATISRSRSRTASSGLPAKNPTSARRMSGAIACPSEAMERSSG